MLQIDGRQPTQYVTVERGFAEQWGVFESRLIDLGWLVGVEKTILEADARICKIVHDGYWQDPLLGDEGPRYRVHAAVSQDTDFFIFNVPYVPLSTLQFSFSDLLQCTRLTGFLKHRGGFATMIHSIGVDKLVEHIGGHTAASKFKS